jgi:hypothetical protein
MHVNSAVTATAHCKRYIQNEKGIAEALFWLEPKSMLTNDQLLMIFPIGIPDVSPRQK